MLIGLQQQQSVSRFTVPPSLQLFTPQHGDMATSYCCMIPVQRIADGRRAAAKSKKIVGMTSMAFYSVFAACIVTMHCCVMAFVPAVPLQLQQTGVTATRDRPAMSAELSFSRGQLLRVIPAAVGAVLLGTASTKPVTAALPTSEDYEFGTGSKVWISWIRHVKCKTRA